MNSFSFIDSVEDLKKDGQITAFFRLKGSEEFLKDHFEGFPVMPGVLLVETLKQAAAKLLNATTPNLRYRLSDLSDARFGQFVKPGSLLKASVGLIKKDETKYIFQGRIDLVDEKSKVFLAKTLSCNFSLVQAL